MFSSIIVSLFCFSFSFLAFCFCFFCFFDSCIKDPEKKADIVEVFNFHFDRKKAEDILEL